MNSLDLRSYGRLLMSRHPFLSQLKQLVNARDFFHLKVSAVADDKLKNSIALLNRDRCEVFTWPADAISKDVNLQSIILGLKVSDLLTQAGRQSLPFFAIHGRLRGACFNQITLREYASIERFINYPELRTILRQMVTVGLPIVNQGLDSLDAYPTRAKVLTCISNLSSKQLRIGRMKDEDTMQCILKIGLLLTPGELLSWTLRLKKLTSTRHKNILLRTVHGDIYSNSRLFKFGLKDDPKCCNCPEPIETVIHKIAECPKAIEAWNKLERTKRRLNLNTLSDLTIENLVGAKDRVGKVELALQAELILKLTSRGEQYCPEQLVKSAVMLVCGSEKLKDEVKQEFNKYKRGER